MRRYKFLSRDSVQAALYKLTSAFLAAKNENEIKQMLFSLFTPDERTKLGRRIQISQMIKDHVTYNDITQELQVGKQTVMLVVRRMDNYPDGFNLISEQNYKKGNPKKKYYTVGGSRMIHKKRIYYEDEEKR
jgi:uncharacterized protein YerC